MRIVVHEPEPIKPPPVTFDLVGLTVREMQVLWVALVSSRHAYGGLYVAIGDELSQETRITAQAWCDPMRVIICPSCKGAGIEWDREDDYPCTDCLGLGWREVRVTALMLRSLVWEPMLDITALTYARTGIEVFRQDGVEVVRRYCAVLTEHERVLILGGGQ